MPVFDILLMEKSEKWKPPDSYKTLRTFEDVTFEDSWKSSENRQPGGICFRGGTFPASSIQIDVSPKADFTFWPPRMKSIVQPWPRQPGTSALAGCPLNLVMWWRDGLKNLKQMLFGQVVKVKIFHRTIEVYEGTNSRLEIPDAHITWKVHV